MRVVSNIRAQKGRRLTFANVRGYRSYRPLPQKKDVREGFWWLFSDESPPVEEEEHHLEVKNKREEEAKRRRQGYG